MEKNIYNIIMIGPPGSGKTMLVKRIPTILPDMNFEESLETYCPDRPGKGSKGAGLENPRRNSRGMRRKVGVRWLNDSRTGN